MGVFLDYLNIWSLLNHPAGVVPVSQVLKSEETGYDDQYNDDWTKIVRKDIQGSEGMPTSVTVVAQPWNDEIIIGIMQAIDQQVKFNVHPAI